MYKNRIFFKFILILSGLATLLLMKAKLQDFPRPLSVKAGKMQDFFSDGNETNADYKYLEVTHNASKHENDDSFLVDRKTIGRRQIDQPQNVHKIKRFKIDPLAVGCKQDLRTANDTNYLRVLVWKLRPTTFYFQKNCDNTCVLNSGEGCVFHFDENSLALSDAVIVNAFDYNVWEVTNFRLPFQKFIFHTHEAPFIQWHKRSYDEAFARSFNVTSTYSFDSDVPFWEYEMVVRKIDETKLRELEENNINYAENKTRKAAWFVSHCDTQSKRMEYVKMLMKDISVDIYGRCGELHCGNNRSFSCYSDLLTMHYKFYLSFENSICKDYVTEKLWRIISNENVNAIPVVLGGANYSSFLPDKTYIDATKFGSPHELGKYLLKIDQDDILYSEYMRRKLAIIPAPWPLSFGSKSPTYASRLCEYLHKTKSMRTQAGKNGDVREFWSKTETCWGIDKYCQACV